MYCSNCGKQGGGNFCAHCGAPRSQPREERGQESVQPGNPKATIITRSRPPVSGSFASADAPAPPQESSVRSSEARVVDSAPGQLPRADTGATMVMRPEDRQALAERAAHEKGGQNAGATWDYRQLRWWILIPAFIALVFGAGHHFEHWVRHDTGWPITSTPSPWTFNLLIYPIVIPAMFMAWRGRLMPGLWLIIGVIPTIFVLIAHFSPVALDPLGTVYGYYSNHLAGALAVIDIFGLVIGLVWLAIAAVRVHKITKQWF